MKYGISVLSLLTTLFFVSTGLSFAADDHGKEALKHAQLATQ